MDMAHPVKDSCIAGLAEGTMLKHEWAHFGPVAEVSLAPLRRPVFRHPDIMVSYNDANGSMELANPPGKPFLDGRRDAALGMNQIP
jgi:hypothetical protein